jgi:hypothetical protein
VEHAVQSPHHVFRGSDALRATQALLNVHPAKSELLNVYGLDDRGSRVRFPAWAGNFSLHYRVQNGSGAHPASYPMGTKGSFLVVKAAGA